MRRRCRGGLDCPAPTQRSAGTVPPGDDGIGAVMSKPYNIGSIDEAARGRHHKSWKAFTGASYWPTHLSGGGPVTARAALAAGLLNEPGRGGGCCCG